MMMNLTAYYMREVDYVVDVVFNGSVSAQAVSGETIVLTVTKPDGTIDTWTTLTLPDKTYTLTKTYVAGSYSVVAHVDADAEYGSADSASVPFTVALTSRTITVEVAGI